MKLPKDQPFWTSVILHIVVLFALFLATIIETLKPKEKLHVFEMVSPPSEQTSMAAATPSPPMPAIPNLDLPDVPELAAVPEPVVQPPAPTPPPPRPTPPAPAPAPVKPKIMTEKEFQERFGTPKPRQQTQAAVPQRRIDPKDFKIDVPKPVIPTNPSATGPRPLTQHELSALDAYSARLRTRIDAAWAKPSSLAGVGVAATVVFDVSASGRITNARLRPGSRNSAFDQSVLAAFSKVISAGPTPTGQAHSFTMTFRMQD